jgi:hypothetical protein
MPKARRAERSWSRWPVVAVTLTLIGCTSPLLTSPDRAPEDGPKSPDIKTVGSCTSVWGAESIRVYGLGVVHGLEDTGSNPPPGEVRRQALHLLKQRGIDNADEVLNSPDTAIVYVSALIPPGVRKDDPLDVVEVELAPDDRATSLRGGTLLACDLHEFSDANRLTGKDAKYGTKFLSGKKLAKAQGPIICGLTDANDKDRFRRGAIWGGGRVLEDRNFGLLLNKDHQDARTSQSVAARVNQRFHGDLRGAMKGMAEAKTNTLVTLRVPPQYRLNWPRYLRVVRQIPLRESQANLQSLQAALAEDLQNPEHCVVAALRLEAMGPEALPPLKNALSHPNPKVRFCAAEALAYLGDPACAEPLAELIREEPMFRAFGLTALASLDESICRVKLRELLADSNAEVRCGAYRALSALAGPRADPNARQFPEGFRLSRLAPDSAPMVHLARSKSAEILVFGTAPTLLPPFSLSAGPDFVVTASEGDNHCIVSRISARTGIHKETCSLAVVDILAKLGELGATYPDVTELLQAASKTEVLSCRLAIDALPQAPNVKTLAGFNPDTADLGGAGNDFGATPNLFSLTRRDP